MADDTLFPAVESDLDVDELVDSSIDSDIYEADLLEAEAGPNPYGVTWKFDFAEGDIRLDAHGTMIQVEGIETLREWIGHTLSVQRGETPIFSDDIGTNIPSLYGSSMSSGSSPDRISQDIRSALQVHDKIADIEAIYVFPLGTNMYAFVNYLTDEQDELQDMIGF